MSRFFRGAFGAEDSKGDFQSFVSDLKYAMSVARQDQKTVKQADSAAAARGSLPRNKFHQAGRGATTLSAIKEVLEAREGGGATAGANKLLQLLGEWTQSPFDHQRYSALAEYVPKAGSSGFEATVKEIMMNGQDLVLHYSDATGCWTMGLSATQRAAVDDAMIEARRQVTLLTTADMTKAPLSDVFDAYFGFWQSLEDDSVKKVKDVFRAVHADMVGSNRCKLILAPPGAKAGARASSRDTLAFVRPQTWPKEKGAMFFLGEEFFSAKKTLKDRAATLIHEATHYFANTDDADENGSEKNCYGIRNCIRMAKLAGSSTPQGSKALKAVLNNAESYCLFAAAAT